MKEQTIDRTRQLRRRCARCIGKGGRKMDVPDLSIVHAKDGLEWERYLDQCFRHLIPQGSGQRSLHIHSEALENLTFPLSSAKVNFFRRSKAQLVILTPEFLDFVHAHPGMLVGQLVEPSRVVAMLCGVDKSDVEATHRAELVSFSAWSFIAVKDQDKDFVLQLFNKVVQVMEVSEGGLVNQKPQFKLTPRKVREGCNKVFALLQSALQTDQEVKVYVTGQKGLATEVTTFKIRNPYVVQFVIPDHMLTTNQIVNVEMFFDGISIGNRQLKCESQMGELNQLLRNVNNPMAFLCQTLGLSGNRMKDLDNLLVKSFRKNLPSEGFQLLDFNSQVQSRKSNEEMPTLIHFAAHYGLRELCSNLLDLPGAKTACNIRNSQNQTPTEMAESEGHKDLAQLLENFTHLSATAELYSLVKCNYTKHNQMYDVLYDYPSNIPLYDSPFPIPIPIQSEDDSSDETYLPMHCSNNSSLTSLLEPHQRLLLGLENDNLSVLDDGEEANQQCSDTNSKSNNKDDPQSLGYNSNQLELLEILQDFKMNKYSLSEVEHLFEDWKNRQKINTFKEKETQLSNLRSKYEQIQQSASAKGKKSLTLDRIKSLISSKTNKRSNKCRPVIQLQKQNENVYHEMKNRPISTFSITSLTSTSSSSSSDRLSTLSVSSTCDSGAQSDSGDDVSIANTNLSDTIKERIPQFGLTATPPQLPRSNSLKEKIRAKQKELVPVNKVRNGKPEPPPRPDTLSSDYVCADPEFTYQKPSSIIRKIESNTNSANIKVNSTYHDPEYVNVTYRKYSCPEPNSYYNVPQRLTVESKPKPLVQITKKPNEDKQQKILDPYPHKKPLGIHDSDASEIKPPKLPPRTRKTSEGADTVKRRPLPPLPK